MYGVLHGKMTMVRIVAMSEDKSLLFIGELSRLQIFGFLHYHMYEFHTSLDGESESKKISFQSFSRDIDAHDRLRSYNDMNNHETTESQIKLQYETDSQKILNIDSSNLTAQFITKTDPNYLRYVSSWTWISYIGNSQKNLRILTDTIISPDSSYARLSPGTEILGYMGGYWDESGNMWYIDMSKIVKAWPNERYVPHSYLLSLDTENRSRKILSLDVIENTNEIIFSKNLKEILTIDKGRLQKIGNTEKSVYYLFEGNGEGGKSVHGFFNLAH